MNQAFDIYTVISDHYHDEESDSESDANDV
jgi:hypothetical protein